MTLAASTLRRIGALVLGVGLASALSTPAQSQQIFVSPNPAPLNRPITITGVGFGNRAGVPVLVFWDNPEAKNHYSNIVLPGDGSLHTDANGGFTFTLNPPANHAYPWTAGRHILTVVYIDYQILDTRRAHFFIDLAPRQGWATPTALPDAAPNGFAGGTLAFLRSSPAGAPTSTSLVVSNGQQERVIGSAPFSTLSFSQPDFSPDGTRIAFVAPLDTLPHLNTYVLDLRNGAFGQATDHGGLPPRITGGGTGTITGSILAYRPNPRPGEFCGPNNPNTNPIYPRTGHVVLVGTGIQAIAALPPGATAGPQSPMPFSIAGIPAGEYSVHMFTNQTVCQERTLQSYNSQTGQTEARKVYFAESAQPNNNVRVTVVPGQVTNIPPAEMLGSVDKATSPTWLTNATLLYNRSTRVVEQAENTLEEVWSVTPGQAPVQHTAVITNGLLSHPAASPPNGLFAGVNFNTKGLIYAQPTNIPGTLDVLTSWLAILRFIDSYSNQTPPTVRDLWPSWDPNGSHLALVRTVPMLNFLVGDIWIQEVATGIERRLTTFNLGAGEGAKGRPVWSPDRTQIAFTYTNDDSKTHNIRVANVKDGVMTQLTNDGLSAFPAWTAARPFDGLPQNLSFMPQRSSIPGDLNLDNSINVSDAVLGLRIIVQLAPAPDNLLQVGDMDASGDFTVSDVIQILRIIVGSG